jgi:CDP-glucose 4,6-dehydratase
MEGFWKHRRTLVTGATGLLGGWLVQGLQQRGADVVCLVRDWTPTSRFVRERMDQAVTVVRGDICDQALIERLLGEYEVQTVVHLAAQTIVGVANRNPISTFQANIAGTWSVLEACRRSPMVQQIVVASSDKAYGAQEQLPYHEGMPLQGRHPYDVSKSCADLIAQSYAHSYQLPVLVTRCGNFYGGGDLNWNRIVPGTIRSVLMGQRPIIRSDGQFVRDYLYVEDGVDAIITLVEALHRDRSLAGQAFNFSTESRVTVLQIVQLMLRLLNSKLEPDVRNEASNEIRLQYLDATRAKTVLKWKPRFQLEQGLAKTIEWYRTYLSSLEN